MKYGRIDLDQLIADRDRAAVSSTRLDVKIPPDLFWHAFSNTDLMNQAVGNSRARIELAPVEGGGTQTRLRLSSKRVYRMTYDELPFEWQAPMRWSVERQWVGNLFRYSSLAGTLEPGPDGGSRLTLTTRMLPRYGFLPGKLIGRIIMREVVKVFRRLASGMTRPRPEFLWEGWLEPVSGHQQKIDALVARWSSLTSDPDIPRRLAEFIHTAPDRFVDRLRPREIAAWHGLDDRATLRFMLAATRAGHLDLSWSILCPSCQGSKGGTNSLAGLETGAHCESCNIAFGALFDENVEVTFRPVASIRAIEGGMFCMGSPANTTDVIAQANVEPGTTRTLDLNLEAGEHVFRRLATSGVRRLVVDPAAPPRTIAVDIGRPMDSWEWVDGTVTGPRVTFQLTNGGPTLGTFKVERQRLRQMAVTAAEVTSLQEFRDQFSSEVLRPGMDIGVSNMVILFSDLKDSTALYERRGDSSAFRLVQDHFDVMIDEIRKNNGAVVKTIGDAVMAVFTRAEDALAAGIATLRAFEAWNAAHDPEDHIIIKLGVHAGSCLAMNLNDKLDYFGTTVNRAARVQGAASGQDLMLSQTFAHLPESVEYLKTHPDLHHEDHQAMLKGFDGPQHLVRLTIR